MEPKKDQVKVIQDDLDYGPAAEARVVAELASVKKDKQGPSLVTLADIKKYDPRTRLVLLLNALSGLSRIPDWQVFQSLKKEFYQSLNGYIGGLTRAAYGRYAHQCQPVIEAARYHREHFVPPAEHGRK